MDECCEKLVIFDADGVFMDEMPYWQTALATALVRHDLAPRDPARWEAVGRACLAQRRVQRITKGRGCNSNWDLAAVMMRALDDAAVRAGAGAALDGEAFDVFAECLAGAMESLWSGPPREGHRLGGFGIDRDGPGFARAVSDFQAVFKDPGSIPWPFSRHVLAHSAAQTQDFFDRLRGFGAELGVCTSRHRDETIGPMRRYEILGYFTPQRIVTQTMVEEAERAVGVRLLGKPHWYPVACAVVGPQAARRMLAGDGGREGGLSGAWIYVGDALADFEAVSAAAAQGLAVNYVHIDTDLTDAETTERIRRGPATRAVVADLLAAAEVLEELLA